MVKQIVFALVSLLSIGCASEPMRVDARFSQADLGIIAQAAAQWAEVGFHVELSYGEALDCDTSHDNAVMWCNHTDPYVENNPLGLCAGYGNESERMVALTWDVTPESMKLPTVLHEFGHVAGLGHTPGGTMDPRTVLDCIDDETARKVGAAHGTCSE